MAGSSLRATRSRFSSPAHPQNGGTNAAAENTPPAKGSGGHVSTSKGFMQRWLEPPTQSKPSFEEHGFARGGVVENMVPLGTLPKIKRPSNDPEKPPPRKKIILKSSSYVPTPSATPSSKADAPLPARASERPEADSNHTPLPLAKSVSPKVTSATNPRKSLPSGKAVPIEHDVPSDEEYHPASSVPRGRRKSGRSVSASKKTRQSSTSPRARLPSAKPDAMVETRASSRTTARTSTPATAEDVSADELLALAVKTALHHHRWPTAYALQNLYDEHAKDNSFMDTFKAISLQTADQETMEKFATMLRDKKRMAVREYKDRGREFFMGPREPSKVPESAAAPRLGPYRKLLTHNTRKFLYIFGRPQGVVDDDETEDEATPPAESGRPSKRLKRSQASEPATPRKAATNGMASVKGSRNKTTPRSHKRTGSDSSLSSAVTISLSPEKGRDAAVGAQSPDQSPSVQRGRQAVGAGAEAEAEAVESPHDGAMASAGGGATARARARARARPKSKAGRGRSSAPVPQPIMTRDKSRPAASSASASASASASVSPTTQTRRGASRSSPSFAAIPPPHGAAAIDDMPGRLATPDALPTTSRRIFKDARKAKISPPVADEDRRPTEEDQEARRRKEEAATRTNGYHAQESSVRESRDPETEADSGPKGSALDTPARRTRQAVRQPDLPSASARATRSVNGKRVADDAESVTDLSFARETSSALGSRAVTPSSSRQAKKPHTGLRVKLSPVKKKSGTAAGVPRSMGEAQSAVDQGAPKDHISDNDEYCSACGNDGDVVCCDGCPRSFHFECLDTVRATDLPDDWYCNECLGKRFPSRLAVHTGVYASALSNLDRTNSRSFALPKKLQTRFEATKAGPQGEYEDVVPPKTAASKRKAEETPDLYKQREDGRAVLCHACQSPASETNAILQCSACPFHWHLDCLEPPLVNPSRTWRCPAHIDDVQVGAHKLAPAHRYRKLKSATAIKPALSRGLKNNGYIEIDYGNEEEEDNHSGWPDPDTYGRPYKVEYKSVVLDFITQLRGAGVGRGPHPALPQRSPFLSPPLDETDAPRRGSDKDHGLGDDEASRILVSIRGQPAESLADLTQHFVHDTDTQTVSQMVQGNAANIAAVTDLDLCDKASLRAMLAQMELLGARIRQSLGDDHSPGGSAAAPQGTTPVSDGMGGEEAAADKLESVPPVTEPTPPSTVDQTEGAMDLD